MSLKHRHNFNYVDLCLGLVRAFSRTELIERAVGDELHNHLTSEGWFLNLAAGMIIFRVRFLKMYAVFIRHDTELLLGQPHQQGIGSILSASNKLWGWLK
ncbi:unnamed protein product [Urochloa humidicola]